MIERTQTTLILGKVSFRLYRETLLLIRHFVLLIWSVTLWYGTGGRQLQRQRALGNWRTQCSSADWFARTLEEEEDIGSTAGRHSCAGVGVRCMGWWNFSVNSWTSLDYRDVCVCIYVVAQRVFFDCVTVTSPWAPKDRNWVGRSWF